MLLSCMKMPGLQYLDADDIKQRDFLGSTPHGRGNVKYGSLPKRCMALDLIEM